MGRFSGKIGFVKSVETEPDVWQMKCTERTYFGDVLARKVRFENGDSVLNDLALRNDISIIANQFAVENLGYMRYIIIADIKWSIISATLEYPRIVLSIGGMYHE